MDIEQLIAYDGPAPEAPSSEVNQEKPNDTRSKSKRSLQLRRGKKRKKKSKQGSQAKLGSQRNYSLRGVLESNLWARKICRDHRALTKDYEGILKLYESAETDMYKMGRSFDRILSSLKTPLIYKMDEASPQQYGGYDNEIKLNPTSTEMNSEGFEMTPAMEGTSFGFSLCN